MFVMALETWSMPADCSWLAAAMSETKSATFLTELTISPSEAPAWLTSSTPALT
jgi:hypothetical protein